MSRYDQYNSPSRFSNVSGNSQLSSASHNLERINSLAEKLNSIQVNISNEKYAKLEKLDGDLKSNGERLVDFAEESQSRFISLRDNVILINY